MSDKKLTLDDILNDDAFGILDIQTKATHIKTDEDRLIDEFEEINIFLDKNKREPSSGSMSEYGLLAKLKKIRNDDIAKKTLKPFDRHNLLGYAEIDIPTLQEVLDDKSGILDVDDDFSVFQYQHIPKEQDRAKIDFVARRKPLDEGEFVPYEKMFHKVHQEIKDGIKLIKPFEYEMLKEGGFYISNGVMLFLKSVNWTRKVQTFESGVHNRPDGRAIVIFENGTESNMMFQSLYKNLHGSNGKAVLPNDEITNEDKSSGWIYILKSKSQRAEIKNIENLYKIGFSSVPVEERIKNAKNEATYLYDDVTVVCTYEVYNINAKKLEQLIHKVFASACLDIEFTTKDNLRINPREWFVIPKEVIEQAIGLILTNEIVHYRFDKDCQLLVRKDN